MYNATKMCVCFNKNNTNIFNIILHCVVLVVFTSVCVCARTIERIVIYPFTTYNIYIPTHFVLFN